MPTGRVEGEYTRVGYAEWEDCSWYGYMCGHKSRPGRDMEKVEGWGSMFWKEGLYGVKPGKEKHVHKFEPGSLFDLGRYHKEAGAKEVVVMIA